MSEASYTLEYVQEQVDIAVAEERVKWERVVAASDKVGDATNQTVEDLTAQLGQLRGKMRALEEDKEKEFEQRLSLRVKELTQSHLDEARQIRLECLDREKSAVKKVRDDMEAALQAERDASEQFLQQLGVDEDERVRKKVKEAKREWLAHREIVEGELHAANQRVGELEQMLAGSEQADLTKAKEQVRRERARNRKIEKQLQSAEAEVDVLKKQHQNRVQQQFQGSLENLTQESPEVQKLHKMVEMYKSEARSLRAQIDARKPEKLVELQDELKGRDGEEGKLRDEIKTLKVMMARQERELKANKDLETEYSKKVELLLGDIQVSRDEIRRMKEKLAKSEKANKSRQEIEEHLRQRAEKAEKKGKALDQKVKSLRAVSFAHSSLECAPGIFGGVGGAGDGAGDAGALQKKVQTLEAARESDRKQLSRKLREQEKVVKELRQALERKDQEMQDKTTECRDKAMHIAKLQREDKTLQLHKDSGKDIGYLQNKKIADKDREELHKLKDELHKAKEESHKKNQDIDQLKKEMGMALEERDAAQSLAQDLRIELDEKHYELMSAQEEVCEKQQLLDELQAQLIQKPVITHHVDLTNSNHPEQSMPTSLADLADLPGPIRWLPIENRDGVGGGIVSGEKEQRGKTIDRAAMGDTERGFETRRRKNPAFHDQRPIRSAQDTPVFVTPPLWGVVGAGGKGQGSLKAATRPNSRHKTGGLEVLAGDDDTSQISDVFEHSRGSASASASADVSLVVEELLFDGE